MVADDMQSTTNEDLLQLAKRAAKLKNYDNARMMLLQIYERDKRHEAAMMWLAKLAQTRADRIMWLQRVLEVNPDHAQAAQALEKLQYKQAAEENRTLLIYGGIAAFMIVLVLALIFVVLSL